MIRKVNSDDAAQIVAIYNQYVAGTTVTFDTEPLTTEEMRERIVEISNRWQYFVDEKDGVITGYCYAHTWKARSAYDITLESTVYVDPRFHHQGIGRKLMQTLIDACRKTGIHTLIACITTGNEASCALHRDLGFVKVSEFHEVGTKFDNYLGVVDYQLILSEPVEDAVNAKFAAIRKAAHKAHNAVNQKYGDNLPYTYHLDRVAAFAYEYASEVLQNEEDMIAVMFGAYFHDSIEDARLTYNDVMKIAKEYMSEEKAVMATEIVYALTNDKGRNRAERARERYYAGIRETPYAPFVKLCDRCANVAFSAESKNTFNGKMRNIYLDEMPHFLKSITPEGGCLPESLVAKLMSML